MLKMAIIDDPLLFDLAMPLLEKVGSKIWNWIMPSNKPTEPPVNNLNPQSFPTMM